MTLNEIAKLSGVSPATVSRYLNNGYVSKEKKERISSVIEKTGYRPLAQAQTLRTRKTKLIGIVLPKIDSESISRIVAGISHVLNEADYQLLLANTENSVDKELEYLEIFRSHNVDGIIFIATMLGKKHKELLQKLTIPSIIIGQNADYISSIYYDDYHAACELAKILIESRNGGAVPGYIGVSLKDRAAGYDRFRGFTDTLAAYGITVDDSAVMTGEFTMDSGRVNAEKLLKANPLVNCIFCATDQIAIGAMQYIQEQGFKIPEDICITGIGNTRMSNLVNPKLTTAHYYYKTSGMEGARLLLEAINGKKTCNTHMMLGYEIVNRGTTMLF